MQSFYANFVAPGDARKGMEVVYKLASVEDPPIHFPLSKSSVEAHKTKAKQLLEEAERFGSWSDDVDKTPA